MRIFVNDLSFDGGFADREQLKNALMSIVRLRHQSKTLSNILYCSRSLRNRHGCANEMLHESLAKFDRDTRVRVLQWLSQHGPFLEDERQPEEDDLFYFGQEDVTDQGLGEAARRVRRGQKASAYSVKGGSQKNFSAASLSIDHGLIGAVLGSYEVANSSELHSLLVLARQIDEQAKRDGVEDPSSWTELLLFCRKRFHRLVFSEHCDAVLKSSPFFPIVARRVIELCKILQRLMECMSDEGALNHEGNEIMQTHFVGKTALFSDEAGGNKEDFESEMTFDDPVEKNRKIVCFWHGKINEPKFRMHFQWPVQNASSGLKVAYIGPKISKR